MPSGDGRRDRQAEAEGGAAEEGALDKTNARRGRTGQTGALRRGGGK
jgi:hypothetical protein